MAVFEITSPKGERFRITAPEGVSEVQALAHFQSQMGGPQSTSLADVASGAVSNFVPSAVNFAEATAQPFMHPIETATNFKNIGEGILQNFGVISGQEKQKYADAVGKFFVDRYGGWENIKRTMATDPVGFLADLSTVLSLGGGAAVRGPGVVGKIGRIAQKAGEATNPISLAGKGGKLAAKAASVGLEATSGVGFENLVRAAEAGGKGIGSVESNAFWSNLAKRVPMEEVVRIAQNTLAKLQADAGAKYRAGMSAIKADKSVLNFKQIDGALSDMQKVAKFGSQELEGTLGVRQQVIDVINTWKKLDPKQYHTPEGFDFLKQKIGEIKDAQQPGTQSFKIASDLYNAVRKTISDQAPVYSKVMKGYGEAKDELNQLQKEFSLGKKVSPGTALRKLQSAMRDGVNSNFGYRQQLMSKLEKAGAETLPYAVAGQQMGAVLPRGLVGRGLAAGGALALGGEGVAHLAGAAAGPLGLHPYFLAAAPLMSPGVVGTMAYGAGLANRVLNRPYVGLGAFQLGRQQ